MLATLTRRSENMAAIQEPIQDSLLAMRRAYEPFGYSLQPFGISPGSASAIELAFEKQVLSKSNSVILVFGVPASQADEFWIDEPLPRIPKQSQLAKLKLKIGGAKIALFGGPDVEIED